jgi:hypothetical protein
MLKKLLMMVSEGFNEERELAHQLNMDEAEVSRELDDLCRKGYLKVSECSPKNMCAAGPNLREDAGVGRKFLLTEKGKKLIYKEV